MSRLQGSCHARFDGVRDALARNLEVDGVRLLRPSTIELIYQEQANGVDLAIYAAQP